MARDGLGGPDGGAVDAYVRSITAHGTDVYVGTDATDVAGIAQADHVARWNGSAWSALGSNTAGSNGWFPASSFIYAMTTSGSLVFATGSFQNANGEPRADDVAYFDGSAWQPVGSNGAGNGPWIGDGTALATYGQKLIAGGNFTSAGGDTMAHGIASYPLVPDTILHASPRTRSHPRRSRRPRARPSATASRRRRR